LIFCNVTRNPLEEKREEEIRREEIRVYSYLLLEEEKRGGG
jgi:hypothetical protein